MHVAVEICRQLIETYDILFFFLFFWGGGGGEYLDFWNRGANNVLTWGGQNFLWSKISRSQRCHLQVLKFGVGEIFWDLAFLAENNRK